MYIFRAYIISKRKALTVLHSAVYIGISRFCFGQEQWSDIPLWQEQLGGMGGGRSVLLVSSTLEGSDFTSTLLGREPIKECIMEVRDNGYKHKLSLTW